MRQIFYIKLQTKKQYFIVRHKTLADLKYIMYMLLRCANGKLWNCCYQCR